MNEKLWICNSNELYMLLGCLSAAELSIILSIFIIPLLFWIIPIIDIMRNEFKGNIKIEWILVVLLLPVFGGILYLLIGRGQKIPIES